MCSEFLFFIKAAPSGGRWPLVPVPTTETDAPSPLPRPRPPGGVRAGQARKGAGHHRRRRHGQRPPEEAAISMSQLLGHALAGRQVSEMVGLRRGSRTSEAGARTISSTSPRATTRVKGADPAHHPVWTDEPP